MAVTVTRAGAVSAFAATALWPHIARAADPVKVTVGVTGSISDAPLYICDAQGYFKDQGLDATLTAFDAGAKMVPFLGNGQLDAGAGGSSAGLFNGIAQGIQLRIVADKALAAPGYGYTPILVRKDLIDSGKVKTLKDLKGLKVAEPGQATASFCDLVMALKKGGLTYKDVSEVYLGFAEMVAAFQNGGIDAGTVTEPLATKAQDLGVAVRFGTTDQYYPNHQTTMLIYGRSFMENVALGRRFMAAYLRGIRDYHDALAGGHLAGPFAPQLIDIMTKYTNLKDASVYHRLVPNSVNPDGHVNQPSLATDLQIYKDAGLVPASVLLAQSIDESYVEAALKTVGPYRPRKA
jgi:NitT/TauT family transport system substrate-binding protein